MPLTATVSSSMSQDVLTTAEVPVDSTSPTPVGVFINPQAGGIAGNTQAEALAVVSMSENGPSTLCHVGRNYATDAGWQSTPLFGGQAAIEVASGTAYSGSSESAVCGFFTDTNGIYSITLQSDNTWSSPVTISSPAPSNLRVAYTPLGALVLYANTPTGDLFTAYQQTLGTFTGTICGMNGALSAAGFQLSMTDESHWTLAVNSNGAPVLYVGALGNTEYSAQETATNFQSTLKSVALSYWSNTQNTLMFLFVDSDDALHVWSTSSNASTPISQQITNSTVDSATGFVDQYGNLHVYSIDTNMNLWVLHQDPNNAWNPDGSPNFAPYISLDTGIGGVASDMNPAESPTLFALDASDYTLRLHAQDPSTMLWATGNVLQSSAQAYEVTRFRTEVALVDSNGVPLPNYPVTLTVAPNYSACEIWSAGSVTPVDSQTEVALSTDATGRLTFAVLTTAGMVTPELILNATGLPNPVTIQPAQPVHTYLSGQGTLNPTNPSGAIPVFDSGGATLAAATYWNGTQQAPLAPGASNSQLAPVAAQAIQSAALVGMGTTPAGVTGYQITNLTGTGNPSFQVLNSNQELQHALAAMKAGPNAGLQGSLWNDIANFFGDIWEGIKNGVIQIVNAVIDVVNKVVNFVVQVGQDVVQGLQIALQGLEQAAHFIGGVFQAVEADIDSVIDWLKALFDFGAIWRTKLAFDQILSGAPKYISSVVALTQQVADGWFSQQETAVNKAFDTWITNFAGKTFTTLPGWQTQGQPPSQTPIAGGASPSDFTGNSHQNWLQDKVNAYTPPSAGNTTSSDLQNAFEAFVTNLGDGAEDFTNALTAFKDGIASTLQDPTTFQTVAIPDFLTSVQLLVESLLHLCDAVVDGFAALADAAMVAFEAVLTTPLDIPILSTLWNWIATAAGYPNDSPLTVSALLSLLAAFPTTVLYKLVAGVNQEPFPGGQFQSASQAALAGSAPFGAASPNCVLASSILQIVYVIPAMMGDLLAAQCPKWLSFGTVGFGLLIWVLGNGFPDLSGLEWATAAAVAVNLVWIAPTIYFVMQTAFTELFNKISTNIDNILAVLNTAIGMFQLGAGIVSDTLTPEDPYQQAAKVLVPLGSAFAFTALIENPLALALKLVMDGVAYVGGGVALTIDATNNLGGTLLAEGAQA
jgi:hypothetical protein